MNVSFENGVITVKGAKGTLIQKVAGDIDIKVEGSEALVVKKHDTKELVPMHGIYRELVHNMVVGVTEGFKKELEVNGVGYRVAKQGKELVMNIGYSHQVSVPEIDGITIDVPAPNKIIVSGPDKQNVGQFAAEIRDKRPPEPYNGKDIKYADEHISRKESNAGKGGKDQEWH